MGFFGDKGSSQPVQLVSPGDSLLCPKQWRYRDTHYWILTKRGQLHFSSTIFKRQYCHIFIMDPWHMIHWIQTKILAYMIYFVLVCSCVFRYHFAKLSKQMFHKCIVKCDQKILRNSREWMFTYFNFVTQSLWFCNAWNNFWKGILDSVIISSIVAHILILLLVNAFYWSTTTSFTNKIGFFYLVDVAEIM